MLKYEQEGRDDDARSANKLKSSRLLPTSAQLATFFAHAAVQGNKHLLVFPHNFSSSAIQIQVKCNPYLYL